MMTRSDAYSVSRYSIARCWCRAGHTQEAFPLERSYCKRFKLHTTCMLQQRQYLFAEQHERNSDRSNPCPALKRLEVVGRMKVVTVGFTCGSVGSDE